ncbi:biliverdin-producing heme oxygenase [Jiella avicenniae]|uniref:Biliverdin-producing heme oxygenase n=1 Tax=Jiella avicenniae TaxID=2907202 RepID=A0A9X1NZF3_9HYPH|nr:biliverdin-producing heme oxygenase [Jiella avicenniae]MCE7028650.1 biliverdin-producing heme oxygenase [Jiella avicenniae]
MNEFAAIRTIGSTAISTPPGPDALRSFLRDHTAESHARLDNRFGAFAGPRTVESYRRFVAMNLLAHRALSAFFTDARVSAATPLQTSVRTNLMHLEADRAAMDLDCATACEFFVETLGAAEIAGLTYVLDGSRLGARFIHRRLEKAGALDSQGGEASARFLRSAFDRDGAGPHGIETPGADVETKERALAAALATFALFERCLDRIVAHEVGKEPSR